MRETVLGVEVTVADDEIGEEVRELDVREDEVELVVLDAETRRGELEVELEVELELELELEREEDERGGAAPI